MTTFKVNGPTFSALSKIDKNGNNSIESGEVKTFVGNDNAKLQEKIAQNKKINKKFIYKYLYDVLLLI